MTATNGENRFTSRKVFQQQVADDKHVNGKVRERPRERPRERQKDCPRETKDETQLRTQIVTAVSLITR